MAIKCYRDLIVWQKSMELVGEIYLLVKKLPMNEEYALSDQMRRAAVSIPSNIAEGQSRYSTKEFIRFLYIARGSISELVTQLLVAVRLGYMTEEDTTKAMELCTSTAMLLNALINKLQ